MRLRYVAFTRAEFDVSFMAVRYGFRALRSPTLFADPTVYGIKKTVPFLMPQRSRQAPELHFSVIEATRMPRSGTSSSAEELLEKPSSTIQYLPRPIASAELQRPSR